MAPRFDAVGIVVSDMAAAIAFYRLLGLEFPDGAESDQHAEAAASGVRLMLDDRALVQQLGPWEPPSGSAGIGLAFLCADPAEVDSVFDRLVEAGHRGHVAPYDAFWGQRYATILDPDGNPVDLFAPLP